RGRAARARARARSGRSRRWARAPRRSCGTPPRPPSSVQGGSRRCRAPPGSTLSLAPASWPSRAAPAPVRPFLWGAAPGLHGSGRTRRSTSQVREVLSHEVNGVCEVAGASYLDSRHFGAAVDRVAEQVLKLVRRLARQRVEVAVDTLADQPERRPFVAVQRDRP